VLPDFKSINLTKIAYAYFNPTKEILKKVIHLHTSVRDLLLFVLDKTDDIQINIQN
jgi:hypothetical protein